MTSPLVTPARDIIPGTIAWPPTATASRSFPPYALKQPAERWVAGDPRWIYGRPSRTVDLAWVQLALQHLAHAGRAAVLTPAGALWRAGFEADTRLRLLQAQVVEAVIALPPGTAPHTDIPLVLWLLCKPGGDAQEVLFVDASGASGSAVDERPRSPGYLTRLDPMWTAELTARVVDAVRAWRQDPAAPRQPGFSRSVPIDELLVGEIDLTPARLVHGPSSRAEAAATASAAVRRLRKLRAAAAELKIPELPRVDEATGGRVISVLDLLASGRLSLIRGLREQPEVGGPGIPVLGPWTFDGQPPRYLEERRSAAVVREGDVVILPAAGGFRALVSDIPEAMLQAPLQALHINEELHDEDSHLDPVLIAAAIEHTRRVRSTATVGRNSIKNLEIPVLDRATGRSLEELLNAVEADAELAERTAQTRAELRQSLLDWLTSH